MKNILLLAALLFPLVSGAVYRIADPVANMCWTDADAKKVCLTDFSGKTAVLLYNAGWCGPCNSEFSHITKTAEKYAAGVKSPKSGIVHEVVFLSLSCDGWSGGSGASEKFLREWDAKYGLTKAKAEFHVLASPRDCGKEFHASPSLPNVAIISESGHLNYKGVAPSASKLQYEIDWAVKEP